MGIRDCLKLYHADVSGYMQRQIQRNNGQQEVQVSKVCTSCTEVEERRGESGDNSHSNGRMHSIVQRNKKCRTR